MQVVQETSARITQAFAPVVETLDDNRDLDLAQPLLHSKQYRITDLVGEGGMGKVYRAYDPMLERDVAIKVLQPGLPAAARKRFVAEARYGARLCHPHLVRVFDLGVQPNSGLDWFAMEYLEGRDLETLLRRAARRSLRLPPRLVGIVFDHMLDALGHAHDNGLIHRDIKPANMFVDRRRGRPEISAKLLDFGVAIDRAADDETVDLCGDPRYVAPEQALGESGLDHRADLYAAGISLFEALSGWHPFERIIDRGAAALIAAHCDDELPKISPLLPATWSATTRHALDAVIRKACAKDPQHRFDDASSMRKALASALSDAPRSADA